MTRPGFNHNDFYHRLMLRQLPPGCGRALDVGCGTGLFARRLARHSHAVDAVDRDPGVIAAARALSHGVSNVSYFEADLAVHDLGLIAGPANLAVNTAIRAISRRRPTSQVNTAPVASPQMTLPEIRREANRLLPGATVRRRLFWRYSLIYRAR